MAITSLMRCATDAAASLPSTVVVRRSVIHPFGTQERRSAPSQAALLRLRNGRTVQSSPDFPRPSADVAPTRAEIHRSAEFFAIVRRPLPETARIREIGRGIAFALPVSSRRHDDDSYAPQDLRRRSA